MVWIPTVTAYCSNVDIVQFDTPQYICIYKVILLRILLATVALYSLMPGKKSFNTSRHAQAAALFRAEEAELEEENKNIVKQEYHCLYWNFTQSFLIFFLLFQT